MSRRRFMPLPENFKVSEDCILTAMSQHLELLPGILSQLGRSCINNLPDCY